MRVALCVLTYRRPGGLAAALGAIEALEPPSGDVVVMVVDNDPHESGRSVVEAAAARCRWPLEYVVEPDRGIPQARNRAVEVAINAGSDFIAFVDDDQIPEPGWLRCLVDAQRRTKADVVVGPCHPRFEEPPPQWVIDGAFFDLPQYQTDDLVPYEHARAGGVLLRRAVLPEEGRPFDERMRLTGGTDTLLFQRVEESGGKIIWTGDAVIFEVVPRTKVTYRWLVRRYYRFANNQSLFFLYLLNPSRLRRARRVASGTLKLLTGSLSMIVAMFRGRVAFVRASQQAAFGAGQVAGALGLKYEEYRRTHGT